MNVISMSKDINYQISATPVSKEISIHKSGKSGIFLFSYEQGLKLCVTLPYFQEKLLK
uniref:Uncharacterized protein n=1 Tax=Rhizophagus irregularis (strain DAOM 181602 / DAOM 197198 / MUCL 43194) TaxID=747089 RepID=U9SP84_RHIID